MQLRFAPLAPDVWAELQLIPRTGWVERGIENPETVAEHTVALMRLAEELVPLMPGWQGHRLEDLLAMLEVHDWPEVITGDEIDLHGLDSEQKVVARHQRESRAMASICAPLGHNGKRISGVWLRFAKSADEVAQFARALDKYQAIEKAFFYEQRGGPQGLGSEFLQYSPPVTHPILVERGKKMFVTS